MKLELLQGVDHALSSRQIVRQCSLDRVEVVGQLVTCGLAFDGPALGCDLVFDLDDLRLLRCDRLGEVVARQCACCDRRLQLVADLFVGIEVGFQGTGPDN